MYIPYSTHLGEVKDSLVAMINTLRQEMCKFSVVEYLEGTAGWNLADSGWVEAVVVVAVTGLDEDCGVG